MTKFILHGGYTRADNNLNRSFYRELINSLPKNGNILLCYFSKEASDRERKFIEDKEKILRLVDNGVFVHFATEELFEKQLKDADVVYFAGGNTENLLAAVNKNKNFKELIRGKVIAGSSAGAYLFSTFNHSATHGDIREGLGMLPIRLICHYKSESGTFNVTEKAIEEINKYPKELELVVLKDFEWKVFEKED